MCLSRLIVMGVVSSATLGRSMGRITKRGKAEVGRTWKRVQNQERSWRTFSRKLFHDPRTRSWCDGDDWLRGKGTHVCPSDLVVLFSFFSMNDSILETRKCEQFRRLKKAIACVFFSVLPFSSSLSPFSLLLSSFTLQLQKYPKSFVSIPVSRFWLLSSHHVFFRLRTSHLILTLNFILLSLSSLGKVYAPLSPDFSPIEKSKARITISLPREKACNLPLYPK